jgi:hypothetical protein
MRNTLRGGGSIPRLAAAITIQIAVAAVVLAVQAAPARADHSWNGYHWGGARPLRIDYLDSLTPGFRKQKVTGAVLEEWELDDLAIFDRVRSDNSRTTRKTCPLATGAIRICNADYGDAWFGHTQLLVEEGVVTGGRIRVNDHWGVNTSFRRFVLCHEVGHSLGLAHREKGSSCLNGGRHPDSHDLAMLRSVIENSAAESADDQDSPGCASGALCIVDALASHNSHAHNGHNAHPQPFTPPTYWFQHLTF